MNKSKILYETVSEINNFIEKEIKKDDLFLSGYRDISNECDPVEEIGIGYVEHDKFRISTYEYGNCKIHPMILYDVFVLNKNETSNTFKKEIVEKILENLTFEDIDFKELSELELNEKILTLRETYFKNGKIPSDYFENEEKYIKESNSKYYIQKEDKLLSEMCKDGLFTTEKENSDYDLFDFDSCE